MYNTGDANIVVLKILNTTIKYHNIHMITHRYITQAKFINCYMCKLWLEVFFADHQNLGFPRLYFQGSFVINSCDLYAL